MIESAARCRHCKSDRIDAAVEFCGSTYGRAVLALDRTGRPFVEHVRVHEEADTDETGIYRCADCGTEGDLDELVEPGKGIRGTIPERLEVGERVVLLDGLRATVATVEDGGETFTVAGWHERFDRLEARLPDAA